MNFGFFADQDAVRYCYLRLRRLKKAIKDPRVLEALARELDVPAADGQKMAAIERQIERLRTTQTSPFHEVPAPEVLAASIFRARPRAEGVIQELFSHAPPGTDLVAPIVTWLHGSGLTPVKGATLGTERLELFGYRAVGLLSGVRIVGVAVRNDVAGIERAISQMAIFGQYAHAMYIACTPATAATYLAAHPTGQEGHWDGEALRRKLQAIGCGLLIVEGDAVSQSLLPKDRQPADSKIEELVVLIKAKSLARG